MIDLMPCPVSPSRQRARPAKRAGPDSLARRLQVIYAGPDGLGPMEQKKHTVASPLACRGMRGLRRQT
jgi:hypothetical protein